MRLLICFEKNRIKIFLKIDILQQDALYRVQDVVMIVKNMRPECQLLLPQNGLLLILRGMSRCRMF